MKSLLKRIECWRQTLLLNSGNILEIEDSELVELRKHSPFMEQVFRRVIPKRYIVGGSK